jgi:AcrR family transcriptional regulator
MAETTTTHPRRTRGKQTRQSILDAARELFLADGYEGVTMRRVAEKTAYSPTAIYVHFADKEALLRELCEVEVRCFVRLFEAIAKIEGPVARLRRIAEVYIEFGLGYSNHYQFMFASAPVRGSTKSPRRDLSESIYAFLKKTTEECLRAGAFRSEFSDTDLLAQTVWAAVHGVVALHLAKRDDDSVEWRPLTQRADLMLAGLLHGLLRADGQHA